MISEESVVASDLVSGLAVAGQDQAWALPVQLSTFLFSIARIEAEKSSLPVFSNLLQARQACLCIQG